MSPFRNCSLCHQTEVYYTSEDMWTHFEALLTSKDPTERGLAAAAVTLGVTLVTYFGLGFTFLILDLSHNPSFLYAYKIQPKRSLKKHAPDRFKSSVSF